MKFKRPSSIIGGRVEIKPTYKGDLLKEGWEEFKNKAIPETCSGEFIVALKQAYFTGASTLFLAIMNILDSGEEATEKDLLKMDALNNEIQAYLTNQKDFLLKAQTEKGGRKLTQ